jgi:short subunit dehydrogenase-like uncharacterized protein
MSSNHASRSNWILYGAYGRSGLLILDIALRRGHRPLLAGRDSARLSESQLDSTPCTFRSKMLPSYGRFYLEFDARSSLPAHIT